MRVPLNWIREFVDTRMDPVRLADKMTNMGLECEANLEGELEGVVVGEVVDVKPHPKTDKNSICTVTTGAESFSVVCGAPNVVKGMKSPMALIGSTLPNGMKIEKVKLRGETSEGMLCSEAELDLGEDASRIWELDPKLKTGERLDRALGLSDWVLEFDLTPNRGDCFSILGIAYEVAAAENIPLHIPEITFEEPGEPLADRFRVEILDPDLCPRYVARLIEGVKIGPSPLWMRRRLQLAGIRPINNVVDVTNYVMWEFGQPLHAFDLELLEKSAIVVKRAKKGEKFVSLDGQERPLNEDVLMICDGVKPVALAGVMGGENSEVRPETKHVLIESALFNQKTTRRTAKMLGMSTEASKRFEREIDPEGSPRAADRASQLIGLVGGGVIAKGRIDAHPLPKEQRIIPTRVSKVNGLLGTDFSLEEVVEQLGRLDIEAEPVDSDTLSVRPLLRRNDLEREVDVIEEVGRVWGYDRIPPTLPLTRAVAGMEEPGRRMESVVRDVMVGLGFTETVTLSFMDEEIPDRLGIAQGDEARNMIPLMNPLKQDQGVMRTLLFPGILEALRRNLHQKNDNPRLFEIARVYLPNGMDEKLPNEPRRFSGAMAGNRSPLHWSTEETEADLFDLKGVLEETLRLLDLHDLRFDKEGLPPFIEQGCGALVYSGDACLGWIGKLTQDACNKSDLDLRPFVFELDFEKIAGIGSLARRYKPLPRFPGVIRDLALLVDRQIPAGTILDEIRGMGMNWFQEAGLFDLYEGGDKVPEGKKSLAFRLFFRADDRNLTDEEVNLERDKAVERLETRFGAMLR